MAAFRWGRFAAACAATAGAWVGLVACTGQGTTAAEPAGPGAGDQAGQPGGVYVMPRGDFAGGPGRTVQEAPAPRSPAPPHELRRLKRSGVGGQVVPPEDSPRPSLPRAGW